MNKRQTCRQMPSSAASLLARASWLKYKSTLDRADFLNHHWKSYLPMPKEAVAAGRIRHIQALDGAVEIWLERESFTKKIQILDSKVTEILIVGDIVAVLSSQEVILLAPFKSSGVWPGFPLKQQQEWQNYISEIRRFFNNQRFLEIKTPTLVPCPGTEPSLDVFSTDLKIGSFKKKLYLPTSPELHLKKALALGADKIFELAASFRNGEKTEKHLPEFLMLEWYRAYENLSQIQQDVTGLICHLADSLNVQRPEKISIFSVAKLFKVYCDFDLLPETSVGDLELLANRLNIDVKSAESIDDYFFLIFTEKIEEKLPRNELIFVEKYPPYQAALARLTADGWGDRFEAYWKGFELANAFHELNDPAVQRLRSEEDLEKKRQLGKEMIPLDEGFFQSLEAGMPPSAGVALGVERLYMALMDLTNIEDLRIFKSFEA